MKKCIGKAKIIISNHIFLSVLIVTVILFLMDITNIFSRPPLIKNISEHYDWLSYFGAIISVYITIKVFEKTLESDRNNRNQDFLSNQIELAKERRLNNKPILVVRSITLNEFITIFNSGNLTNKIGVSKEETVITSEENYISPSKNLRVLHIELKNIGLNHAIINSYKINKGQTQELYAIHTKIIVEKGDYCYLTLTFPDNEFEKNGLRIHYTDIFSNCYYSEFALVDIDWEKDVGKDRYIGKIRQDILSKFDDDRTLKHEDLD